MSHINKYQESISKFIKTRSCLATSESDNLRKLIECLVGESDKYGSILLLTVMNTQNKKNKMNVHGYDAAVAVEFLSYLIKIRNCKTRYEDEFGITGEVIVYNLYSAVLKSVILSTEVTKRSLEDIDQYHKIHSQCLSLVINDVPDLSIHEDAKRIPSINDNIYRFYLNTKPEYQEKYMSLTMYEPLALINRYRISYCRIFQTAISLGWLLTGSTEKDLNEITKVGVLFGFVHKIGGDFERIDDDLELAITTNGKTDNYLLNCGLQKAYEDYMNFKQSLITILMLHDLYSRTVKEMIEEIDERVDCFIEASHPDLKSSYSQATH